MKTQTQWVRVGRRLVECVTAREAARLTGVTEKSFRTYSAEQRPKNNPPPEAVGRDMETGAKLYPRDEVIAWGNARPGRGNWGSTPARCAQV